jgi:non-ribosomal peptide synthetase component F
VAHIIFDEWSFGILAREISLLYSACLNGEPCPLAPLLVQYSDYSIWQREWLQGEALEKQVNYWRQKLQGITPLNLPTDKPRPAIQTFDGGIETFTLPEAATSRLRHLSRTEDSTLFMTLLAVFKVLLAWHSGQTDIAVGAGIANRGRSELEPLIGFFVNTIVLRTDLAGNPTFRELLRRIRETTLGAYAHQDLPFERLLTELELIRDPSRPPLYQVVFGLDTLKRGGLELAGISCSLLGLLPVSAAKAELTMVLEDGGVNITGALEYNSELFSSATPKTLIALYTDLIVQIGERPDTSLDALSQSLTQLKLRHRNIRYQAEVARLKAARQQPAVACE